MTVSAQTPINRSTGNGVTTVFPYTFKIIADADIEVTVDDAVKTLNVDYTVSGAGVDAGGNVTMTAAPANATSVVRRRNMALVRSTDYQDQGELPATTLDNDIDATVLMVQQLDERLDRTFSLPASFSGDSTLPAPEPGYLIGWDATGENLTNIPASVGSSLVDLAAPSGSSLVGYLPAGTGAVPTTVQAKLRERVSVLDFGAVGDGVTDDTAAIQAALNVGGRIIFPNKGTYLFTGVTVTTACELDLQGSTLKRSGSTDDLISITSGAFFTVMNGTIDGDNTPVNGGHLLYYSNASGALKISNVNLINNCLGYPTPTLSQDTDHVYVLTAASVEVENSKFKLASRQGISVTGAVVDFTVTNSLFEDCYLFGIDLEPNSVTTHMIENVTCTGNTFRNCGSKNPPTDYVWNSGGPFSASSGADYTINFIKDIVFSNNTIQSYDFLNASAYIEPFIRIDQFKNLVFSDNVIDNLGSSQIAPFGTGAMQTAQITGNVWTLTGTQDNYISIGASLDKATLAGNHLHYVYVRCVTANIAGNTFKNSALGEGIHCFATCTDAVISGNFFNGITTCIAVTDKSSNYTITGNRAIGYTTFVGTVTTSQVANNIDGKMQGGPATITSTTVSVPSGVTTTVLDLTGVKQMGMISVFDAGGTRVGSYGMYGNFYDGSNNASVISSVQNSGVYSSALTLSGNTIQFAHAYGSTRTVTVSVVRFP